jgi:NADH-quinone oxidoreductase subunit D/NADH-quinone oxidoreductase subunit C/D
MTQTTAPQPLGDAVPGSVQAEENGATIVAADKLVELGTHLRDHEGYDYLSMITSVDYPDYFEVVYYLYGMRQPKGPLVLKVRTDKTDPQVPSLVPVWPGADFQEREVYDMMGIRFPGHPNLKRILLWEGFHGYPLRKDWQEPYFEEEKKPFSNRHPDGIIDQAEDRTPLGRNVRYPAGWDPVGWEPPSTVHCLEGAGGNGSGLKTQQIVVNMGPQHPSTHGVFRMLASLDGETITALEPVVGYLHRCHEKIGERNTYIQNIPYTDRLDYVCSMSNNLGYVLAVEKLMGLEVPERAEYIRVIMAELTRLVNHYMAIGFLFNDLGAFFTPALYGLEERELILDLFEMASGSRMMCNYMRFGGVARDLPPEFLPQLRHLAFDRIDRVIDQFEDYLTGNEIFHLRSKGIGYLSADQAIALSTTGPLLRASDVPYDIRKAEPYSIYDRFDFDVVTDDGCDVYARYVVRIGEMRESAKILRQAVEQLPEGEIQTGRKRHQVKVPEGEAYARIAGPKGELGYYVVSDGSPNPYRYHIRAGALMNLHSLAPMSIGYKVADVVTNLGSIDITLGEVDR